MGEDSFISEKSIVKDAKIGKGVKIWHYCNINGCRIGDNTQIGSYCEIKKDVTIGSNCRIQAFVFIPEKVIIEDYVFIGPGAILTNDKYPTAKKTISGIWECEQTIIRRYASIGARATICPGVTIAEGTVIGAGSCLTKGTKAFSIMAGNPAKKIGDIRNEKHSEIYRDIIEGLKDLA